MVTDAWCVGSEHRGYQLAEDSIGIFINFKMVFETKSKEEAKAYISRITLKVPRKVLKEFEGYGQILLDACD